MEVGEKGKRRASWDFNKGRLHFFKCITRGKIISDGKPNLGCDPKPSDGKGYDPNPTLTQHCVGFSHPPNSCFSGPSIFEVGEHSSKASSGMKPLAHTSTAKESSIVSCDHLEAVWMLFFGYSIFVTYHFKIPCLFGSITHFPSLYFSHYLWALYLSPDATLFLFLFIYFFLVPKLTEPSEKKKKTRT